MGAPDTNADLLIAGGTVVTAERSFVGDVEVRGGHISAIGVGLPRNAHDVIDASGHLVLSGGRPERRSTTSRIASTRTP